MACCSGGNTARIKVSDREVLVAIACSKDGDRGYPSTSGLVAVIDTRNEQVIQQIQLDVGDNLDAYIVTSPLQSAFAVVTKEKPRGYKYYGYGGPYEIGQLRIHRFASTANGTGKFHQQSIHTMRWPSEVREQDSIVIDPFRHLYVFWAGGQQLDDYCLESGTLVPHALDSNCGKSSTSSQGESAEPGSNGLVPGSSNKVCIPQTGINGKYWRPLTVNVNPVVLHGAIREAWFFGQDMVMVGVNDGYKRFTYYLLDFGCRTQQRSETQPAL
ncbi:hypothetical protein BDW74DRAFT_183565 [Aspergillus multicolor]|uniref:uncharacterized protein n=1 Tax=Aspergillus multicolor TaxID=41759 RepID=UPI003CCE1405